MSYRQKCAGRRMRRRLRERLWFIRNGWTFVYYDIADACYWSKGKGK
jgi:hypothetical protein